MSVPITEATAVLRQLQPAVAGDGPGQRSGATGGAGDFGQALMHALDRVDALRQTANVAARDYESSAPGVGLDQVVVDMARADVALNMGVRVRNQVVGAYRDIMNMQV